MSYFKNNDLKEVKTFTLLHEGWELDGVGYVCMNKQGKLVLVLSSCGHFYIAKKSELEKKIAEYEQLIKEYRKVISMIQQ